MQNLPKARTVDILEMEAGSELLVYDLRINKAYNLNETSKAVYLACGGQTNFDQLKRQFRFTDDLIYFALHELKTNNLIENYQSSHFAGMSRREVIRRVGLASITVLPLISGIAAPQAANAASGFAAGSRTTNQTCNTSTECNQVVAPQCIDTINGFLAPQGRRCCVASARADGSARTNSSGYVLGARNQSDCDRIAPGECCSGRGTLSGSDCFCQ